MKKIVRFFRKTHDLINKLPLAGKISIQQLSLSVFSSAYPDIIKKIIQLFSLLFFIDYFHLVQVFMGWQITKGNNILFLLIGYVYMITNLLVIYTHIILIIRVVRRARRVKKNKRVIIKEKKIGEYSAGYAIFCIVVTLAGQMIVLVFWFSSKGL